MKVPTKTKLLKSVVDLMTDSQLIELTLSGEPVAFDALAKRYRPRVKAVASQFLRGTDREDCIQETFLKALVNLSSLRNPEKFGSWVCVIARNYCLDTLKKSGAISSMDDDSPCATPVRQFASPYSTPLAEAIRGEDSRRLREGINRLGDNYRKILDMRYFEGCDYEAIALKLHKPLGTVKSLIHRAHGQLRELILDGSIQEGGAVVN
jgi:RNA polymerase sigma factor (sigma-70 family)